MIRSQFISRNLSFNKKRVDFGEIKINRDQNNDKNMRLILIMSFLGSISSLIFSILISMFYIIYINIATFFICDLFYPPQFVMATLCSLLSFILNLVILILLILPKIKEGFIIPYKKLFLVIIISPIIDLLGFLYPLMYYTNRYTIWIFFQCEFFFWFFQYS